VNGFRDHFMEKHATDDQKCFPCKFCGKLFGTNALKNKHQVTFTFFAGEASFSIYLVIIS
jgi:hypothetical protein